MRQHQHETAVVVVASLGTAELLLAWLRHRSAPTHRVCFVWSAHGHVELHGVFRLRRRGP